MKDQPCILSVIVPCFNHGRYIQEALDSLNPASVTFPFEVIIVDDGSSEPTTLQKLDELERSGYLVIRQQNAGPAAARNTGIRASKGKYILPLDADNRITPEYINTAIPILEEGKYQVVYSKPVFFSDQPLQGRQFRPRPFDIADLLESNYIDCCSFFTKELWETLGGFDTALPYFGHEDWEFWINAYEKGFRFYFIDKPLFYYRILPHSEASKFRDREKLVANHNYIAKKHSELLLDQHLQLNYLRRKYKTDIRRFVFAPFLFLGYMAGFIRSPFRKAALRSRRRKDQ